ncbi:MAG: hypothetical protein JSR44_00340 [Spirochaetes bacterium]|nr:hypothetical protein [Spirochaetota bacterium]
MKNIKKNARFESALLNLLKLEIKTNLALLDAISSENHTDHSREIRDVDLSKKINFLSVFCKQLRNETLSTFISTTAEDSGLRGRLQDKAGATNIEDLAISAIRKQRTISLLLSLPQTGLKKIRYAQRFKNLRDDYYKLLQCLQAAPQRKWYQF